MLAEGGSYNSIKVRLQTTAPTIGRWKQRFLAAGLDRLDAPRPGQKTTVLTAGLRRGFFLPSASHPRWFYTGVAANWPPLWASARTPYTASGRKLG